jgi:acetyl esterase
MNTDVQDIVIEDREYLRHGDQPLMVRLLRPAGEGPFPFVIDLHGGAWNNSDRFSCQMRDEILVEAGIAAAAVDFRHGPDQYPSSLADINYAIRWLKLHADELRLDPARIGITGASSGGHLAMLTAMRPTDPRYIEIVGETAGKSVDASLKCVALVAPVINPLSRYRNAQRLLAEPNPPEWATGIPDRHDTYWGTAEAMAEGSPQLILERGERATLLP